jgi:hypothetical protein
MRTRALLLALTTLLLACGETEDDSGKSADAPSPEASESTSPETESVAARCRRGCELTVQAACSNGPPSQAACEEDCAGLQSGPCGAEYEALASCSDGKPISCDASGIPVITACSDEQDAMVQCQIAGG